MGRILLLKCLDERGSLSDSWLEGTTMLPGALQGHDAEGADPWAVPKLVHIRFNKTAPRLLPFLGICRQLQHWFRNPKARQARFEAWVQKLWWCLLDESLKLQSANPASTSARASNRRCAASAHAWEGCSEPAFPKT